MIIIIFKFQLHWNLKKYIFDSRHNFCDINTLCNFPVLLATVPGFRFLCLLRKDFSGTQPYFKYLR